VTHDDGNLLGQYEWPGNISELQHVIEHADNLVASISPQTDTKV
jgi:transcriptional regulator with PAS, ATPase and Fis domain